MFKILFLLVGPLQWVDCGCTCSDGVAKMLCDSVEEAKQHANICPLDGRCPTTIKQVPETNPPRLLDYLDAPNEQAHNCREVRVWDERVDDYTGVRVCDVYAS